MRPMWSVLLVALACRTHPVEQGGDVQAAPDLPEQAAAPVWPEVDDAPAQGWEGRLPSGAEANTDLPLSNCPFEEPQSAFNGDLRHLAFQRSTDGPVSYAVPGSLTPQVDGTVSWTEGHYDLVASYAPGFYKLDRRDQFWFELTEAGDYQFYSLITTTELSGRQVEHENVGQKIGCVTSTSSTDVETGTRNESVSTLVSASERRTVSESYDPALPGWSFKTVMHETDDWVTQRFFAVDDPDTEVSPDRSANCLATPDGFSFCETVSASDNGGWSIDLFEQFANGDWKGQWEQSWSGGAADSWGWRAQEYQGGGETEWTQRMGTSYVDCQGWWDTEGVGEWFCENGWEGVYE